MNDYQLFRKYSHRRLLRDDGRLIYMRPRTVAGYWQMVVHHPCENGDGGVLLTFERNGRKWEHTGVGRFRYCQKEHQCLFPEIIPPAKEPRP